MSLTVRHKAGMNLEGLRKGLSRAWRRLQQTRSWREARKDCGVDHLIRAHEVTWGGNGFHPHLHVMLLARYPELLSAWQRRLVKAWRHCVVTELGAECLPTKRRALTISTCRDDYIAKMGLELASLATKEGRDGHFTPWQIARRILDGEDLGSLWRTYADGMNGCHQLQWSRGLKEAAGIKEVEPEDVAGESIGSIPKETWSEMADEPGALATLRAFGSGSGRELAPDLAREWLLEFFAIGVDHAKPFWKWVDGRAFLRWRDTS